MWGEHAHRWAGVGEGSASEWMGGSFSSESCFSVRENWDCLCSCGAVGSGQEKSLWQTEQRTAERHGVSERSSSDLRLHISFICFSETSHLIFISPQQSLVLGFHDCVLLFFWACLPALWLRYALNLHVLETRTRRFLYALRAYVRCWKNTVRVFLMNWFVGESVRESTHWDIMALVWSWDFGIYEDY